MDPLWDETDPEIVLRQVEAKSTKPIYLYIDEIQKCPGVLDVLQYLIDKKKIVLMASGSSARKMRQTMTNWLPGRVHLEYLYPLTWGELGLIQRPQELNQFLLFGSLPEISSMQDIQWKKEHLTAYSHFYLEEEIRKEALVKKLPLFNKFLQLAALESGTSPNFSKISNQIGVSHPTVKEYYQILEDTLIVNRLEMFGSRRNHVLGKSKYYFFDLGVRNAAAKIGHSQGVLTLQTGILFEHFIVLECLAHWQHKAILNYWGDGSAEVDLIWHQDEKIIAIEIKATRKPHINDFKGINKFNTKYKTHLNLLVCQIDKPQRFEAGLAIPWWMLHDYLKIS